MIFTKSLIFKNLIQKYTTKALLSRQVLFRFSSVNPQPNPNPQNNQKQSQQTTANIKTNAQNDKKFTTLDQKQSKKIRAQALLKVRRSQLAKFAKAEFDYEKMNTPTKEIQKMTRYLNSKNIKIKPHSQLGTRLQFYRPAPNAYKPSVSIDTDKDDNKQGAKDQKPSSQPKQQKGPAFLQIQFLLGQQQDNPIQMKIFMNSTKQLTNSQNKFLDNWFYDMEDPLKQLSEKMMSNVDKNNSSTKQPRKGFINFQMKTGQQQLKKVLDKIKNANLSSSSNVQQDAQTEQEFKQFSVYLRNARTKSLNKNGQQKWLKVDLMLQKWQYIHLHHLSIIQDMKMQIQNPSYQSPTKYKGVQAHQLDATLLDNIKQLLRQQYKIEIDAMTLSAVYYYTGLQEHRFYRKWLEDLVNISK